VLKEKSGTVFCLEGNGKVMDSVSPAYTASKIQMDYMKLLVTQLRNQDPLEPLDNNEMAMQLAQFSQLSQLESMNSNFARVLATTERAYASSLIGKNIEFLAETQTGAVETMSGIVERIYNNVDGEIFLAVGDYAVSLENVISVKN
jgi:flagellar basal-body rod modification protein FlgD